MSHPLSNQTRDNLIIAPCGLFRQTNAMPIFALESEYNPAGDPAANFGFADENISVFRSAHSIADVTLITLVRLSKSKPKLQRWRDLLHVFL